MICLVSLCVRWRQYGDLTWLVDGVFVIENMVEPTQIVESVEDPVFTVGDQDNTQM